MSIIGDSTASLKEYIIKELVKPVSDFDGISKRIAEFKELRGEKDILIRAALTVTGCSYDRLMNSQKKEAVLGRSLIALEARIRRNTGYRIIGKMLGGKDHATIIHCIKKLKDGIKRKDPYYLTPYNKFCDYLISR